MNRKTFLGVTAVGIGAALGLPKIASSNPCRDVALPDNWRSPRYGGIITDYDEWQKLFVGEEPQHARQSIRHLIRHKGRYATSPAILYDYKTYLVKSRAFDTLDAALTWANDPKVIVYSMWGTLIYDPHTFQPITRYMVRGVEV